MQLPTLEEYRQKLNCHDWFYYFSDDPRVYQLGEDNSSLLHKIAVSGGKEYQKLYNEVHNRVFNNEKFLGNFNIKYKRPFDVQ